MPTVNERDIQNLRDQGKISPLDLHFARLMAHLSKSHEGGILLASVLVSHVTSQGHVCLDLRSAAGKSIDKDMALDTALRCPEIDQWVETLKQSGVVGTPGQYRPLILDENMRLYLYRYWDYEMTLALGLISRAHSDFEEIDLKLLGKGLSRHFENSGEIVMNWQKVAAFQAVTKRLCIISGGPGTGKSSLVASIISLIFQQEGREGNRVAFAAPTGKAAARMQEAISKATRYLTFSNQDFFLPEASTIHRLLGTIPGSPYFRHNEENPLPCDTLVVDEVSMVDLALLSKLIRALPAKARLILLGDKDQLASVEAGAVLGDICSSSDLNTFSDDFRGKYLAATGEDLAEGTSSGEGTRPGTGIQDCLVELKKNYRFGPESGIGRVSKAVKEGDSEGALALLKGRGFSDAKWMQLPSPRELPKFIRDEIIRGYEPYLKAANARERFTLFDHFRVLCVTRRGPYGLWAINQAAEQTLKRAGLINPATRWYPGRPILVTENDYNLGLFNGDTGIIMPDFELEGEVKACFLHSDRGIRKFLPARLPQHETAFAMTVHKSQGSEFEKCLFILPGEPNPILTRELIYTALTRAAKEALVWGKDSVFAEGVSQRTTRTSGLHDALWKGSFE